MKKFTNKQLLFLNIPIVSFLVVLMIVIGVLVSMFSAAIQAMFNAMTMGGASVDESTLSAGAALCEDITEEGTVLLKNKETDGKKALPLTEAEIARVNVFGWAGYDWMTSTFGSGYSNTALEKVKLFDALDKADIEYNETLFNMYKNFYSAKTTGYGVDDLREYRGDVDVGKTKKFILHEPGAAYYTPSVINEAREFSSVALVVIGRTGGEAADLRLEQTKQKQENGSDGTTTITDRHYLQLSTEEEEMIAAAKQACQKVIVILNTSNTMETGFLEDDGIDGALLVGLTGITGINSVINILRGEKTIVDGNGHTQTVQVSPSGRTADTYAYDIMTAPSSVSAGYQTSARKYTGLGTSNNYNKGYFDAYIDYAEGIYVGYKWYETADAEGYWSEVGGYDKVVQYPFGYGLSYTDFTWSVQKIEVNGTEQSYNGAVQLTKNAEIKITIEVQNVGSVAGMDVVEAYFTPPYTKGKTEKASVNLIAFAKTPVIEAGESKEVVLEFAAQSMASYDCYDKNGNGHTGYELDSGAYAVRLMKNSHEVATDKMATGSKTGAEISYTVPSGGFNYDTDSATGNPVKNRFTGNDTIDNADLDGSKETVPVQYLTRENFKTSFPTFSVARARSAEAYSVANAVAPTSAQLEASGYGDVETPLYGTGGGYTMEDMIDAEGYDDEEIGWEEFIAQISKDELFTLIKDGYFKTAAIESIGKEKYTDLDGPLGLNTRVISNKSATCNFVAYPSETLLAQTFNVDLAKAMGISVGQEATDSEMGIRGWYGPAANIHRNPLNGRNAENYSEDALLSGKMAASVVYGAKTKGLYCYMKHYAANETESLREGLFTFMSEQTLREIYLRPFELAVKEGKLNAMMSSMNRVGRVWAGASRALCTEILRNEWGFNGTIVTDWVDSGCKYMPVYKGIWAGNDLWLNSDMSNNTVKCNDYANNDVFITLSQKVAKDVVWTLIDCMQFSEMGLSDMKGAKNNTSWYWLVAGVEALLFLGIATDIVFVIRKWLRNVRESKCADYTNENRVVGVGTPKQHRPWDNPFEV